MYTIAEDESFLPALVSNNPTKQLAQVRGYYDRQQRLALYLTQDVEDIRMAYSLKLCKEKGRLSKSLWELDNKKRRLFHQIVQHPSTQTQPSWKWKHPARKVSLVVPPQRQTELPAKQRRKKPPDKETKTQFNLRRIELSRLDTQQSRIATQQSRITTQQSVLEQAPNPKPQKRERLARPVVPQFLFC